MERIIDNRVGEPDLSLIPAHVLPGRLPKELYKLIEYGYSLDRQGMPRTLKAVADYFNKTHELSSNKAISPEQIVMADGARAASSIVLIYLQKKYPELLHPRAIILRPGYNLYTQQLADLSFTIDYVDLPYGTSDDERIKLIKRAITKETRVISLNNPNNPTGEIYRAGFLKKLLALLNECPDVHILNDSIYDRIYRAGVDAPPNIYCMANAEQRKRVFDVNGLSKNFAYPAIRAGWVISEEKVIEQIQHIKDPILGPLNNIAQLVTISALEYTPKKIPSYFEKVNEVYDARLKLVHEKLRKIKGFKSEVPEAGIYYWASFLGLKVTAKQIVEKLEKKNIFLSWGKKFGDENSIRINCGANERDLSLICDAIVEVCK